MNATRQRQILIHMEGLAWSDLRQAPLSGDLPTFAQLLSEGSSSALASALPSGAYTGPVSLASGLSPHQHGIFNPLHADSPEGPLREVTGRDWSPVWDRLTALGDRCLVFGWPLTHPIDPRLHLQVSDRFPWPSRHRQHRETLPTGSLHAPQDQLPHLSEARLPASKVDLKTFAPDLPDDASSTRIREILAADFSIHDALLTGLYSTDWDFAAVSFASLPKIIQTDSTFRTQAYQHLDRLLASLIEQLPPKTLIHLVSSQSSSKGEALWLIHGPEVKTNHRFQNAHVLEVAPTILALRGDSPDPELARKARLDFMEQVPTISARDPKFLPLPPNPPTRPWEYLLHDGRLRTPLTAKLRRNQPSITRYFQAALIGKIKSLQDEGQLEEARRKAGEFRRLFPPQTVSPAE